MIVLDNILQGSSEWHTARLGVLTASRLSEVVTPAKLAPSKSARKLMAELIAEIITGEVQEDFGGNVHTERGLELEGEAMDAYALATDLEPRLVGLCYRDESKRVACSPDWLVDPEGGAEVKCKMAKAHVLMLMDDEMPADHRPQVQGSLWVTGRDWWDFVAYHPGMPPIIERHEPDPKWQAALDEHIPAFLQEMDEAMQRLRERGVTMEAK